MQNQLIDFNAFVDASKKAFAPALKFNELALKNTEKLVRQQFAFTTEAMDLVFKHLHGAVQAKDVNELTSKQVEFATQLVEKSTARSQDFVKIATEAQAEVSKWFDETAAEYAAAAKKDFAAPTAVGSKKAA